MECGVRYVISALDGVFRKGYFQGPWLGRRKSVKLKITYSQLQVNMACLFFPITQLQSAEDRGCGPLLKQWSMVMRTIILGLLAAAPLIGIMGDDYAIAGRRTDQLAAPGHCGVYMYWQQGKCIDATGRPRDMSWGTYILKYGTWHQ
jgi:hypothetical protein